MIRRVCASIMATIGPPTVTVSDAGRHIRRRHIRPCVNLAPFCAGFLLAAGPAVPVLADALPRDALPSSEAIGWLLETETTGSAVPWANSRSGYSGTVTATQTWYRADDTPCREYVVTATAGGPRMTVKGTGCRVATGAWNLSEDAPARITVAAFSPPSKKPPEPDALSPDALSPDAPSPETPSPDIPGASAAQATAEPAVPPTEAPPPAPAIPAGSDASFTTAGFSLPMDEHEPATIRARLPSRSDE